MEFPCFISLNRNALCDIHNIKLFKMKKAKKNMKEKFFVKKGVIWMFAAIALFFGFWFLDSSFTGNAVVNKQVPVSLLSLIGLLLIVCSAVLISYSVKKK